MWRNSVKVFLELSETGINTTEGFPLEILALDKTQVPYHCWQLSSYQDKTHPSQIHVCVHYTQGNFNTHYNNKFEFWIWILCWKHCHCKKLGTGKKSFTKTKNAVGIHSLLMSNVRFFSEMSENIGDLENVRDFWVLGSELRVAGFPSFQLLRWITLLFSCQARIVWHAVWTDPKQVERT